MLIIIEIRIEKKHVKIIKNNYELIDFNLVGHEEYDSETIMNFLSNFLKENIEKSIKKEE